MRRSLSIVRLSELPENTLALTQYASKRSLEAWTYLKNRELARSHTQQLSTADFLRVNLATVRESYSHRHWPREVVEKFLAAEIINNHIDDN